MKKLLKWQKEHLGLLSKISNSDLLDLIFDRGDFHYMSPKEMDEEQWRRDQENAELKKRIQLASLILNKKKDKE